jgi:predicted RNA-binding Zn-ribbon protein involved in translation (DUF1610 family)
MGDPTTATTPAPAFPCDVCGLALRCQRLAGEVTPRDPFDCPRCGARYVYREGLTLSRSCMREKMEQLERLRAAEPGAAPAPEIKFRRPERRVPPSAP